MQELEKIISAFELEKLNDTPAEKMIIQAHRILNEL